MTRITMTQRYKSAQNTQPPPKLLPLAAMMLAGSLSATPYVMAQDNKPEEKTLKAVTVKDKAEVDMAEGKNSVRATETRIGKGQQALRDIPQSVTVVTEKLIDDRNLDTMKDALKNTAGVTFQAAEGQEEDIRLRGFSLQQAGDIFIDGMRDPAFYERDTFNLDRLEVLRGSASMLFGRGSTGGAVNQVSKTPRLMDENQVDLTLGSHNHKRLVGDFNKQTGESAALRLNVMKTQADNDGKGNSLDKEGLAGSYRWGIGERDEFQVGLFHLSNHNGLNYGLPWAKPSASASASERTVLPFDPKTYLGMDSDYKGGKASQLTASHVHRFDQDTELRTQVRKGQYERDQRASAIRFTGGSSDLLANINGNTQFSRGTNNKIEDLDSLTVQSDFSTKFQALGFKHELITGADLTQEKKNFYSNNPGVTGSAGTAFWNTTGVGNKSSIYGNGTLVSGTNSVNEGLRQNIVTSDYEATSWGVYAQDMMAVTDKIKLIGGLRYDKLDAKYKTYGYSYSGSGGYSGISANGSNSAYNMDVGVWSQRVGALYQPNELHSFHISYGTSFNTSGDTYRLSSTNENLDPEKSVNFEIGAKLDSADKRFTTRLALFRSTKLNERNRDADDASLVLLSGKRHATGIEVDLAGRITPKWEMFASYTWIPDAKVDAAGTRVSGGTLVSNNEAGELPGARPAVTPQYSGTVWTTYQLNSQWRVGGGLTFRGEQKPLLSQIVVPAHTVGDLMVEYTHSDALSIKANLSNVTNKLYADELYRGHYVPGAGRLLQVTASFKF
jgi:catecholate siderophore receptor